MAQSKLTPRPIAVMLLVNRLVIHSFPRSRQLDIHYKLHELLPSLNDTPCLHIFVKQRVEDVMIAHSLFLSLELHGGDVVVHGGTDHRLHGSDHPCKIVQVHSFRSISFHFIRLIDYKFVNQVSSMRRRSSPRKVRSES